MSRRVTEVLSILAILTLTLSIAASSQADDRITRVDRDLSGDSFLGWVPDRIVVQFKEPLAPSSMRKAPSGTVAFTDLGLDALSSKHVVVQVERQFKGAKKPFGQDITDLTRHYKVTFLDGSDPLDMVAAFKNNPSVATAEPIGIHRVHATPNDTYYSPYQTYHNQTNNHDIDSPEAWNVQTGSSSIIVADLDSGTRYYHPDLGGANASPSNPGASRGNMWTNSAELNGSPGVDDDGNGFVDDWIGWDFIQSTTQCWSGEDCSGQDNDPRDFNGHGTHTAGIVAMLTNDGYGMAGVAGGWGNGSQAVTGNGVKLMALRMGYSYNYLGQEYGVVLMDAAAEAFYYAAANGAKIATCSWGSSNSGGIAAAVNAFTGGGGLVFVAAGNDGTQTAGYLNSRSDCISVAAVTTGDAQASFTTYGTWVDISAPGTAIYSTYHDHTDPNTNYWSALDGTSMACPMAAGVGAMIWSQNPGWTASQVESQLYSSSDNIDAYLSSAYIGKMGAGRINMFNAVNTGGCGATTPVANFSGSPTSGENPLGVSFSDASTNSPTSWSWTFGDGGTSSVQNPSHTYTAAGSYTVTLSATNCAGSDGNTKTNYITVTDPPGCTEVIPVAAFSGTPTSGTAPLSVSFTDASSNTPDTWSWDFGDGGASSAQNPSYAYNAAGTYTVTLTASNCAGSDQVVNTNYVTVTSGGGGVTGEGFVLSRNADFSTDDRAFLRTETIYMKVWTDQVDMNDLKRSRWELKDANGDRIRQPMTNNMDNTYTASFALSGLPSTLVDWTWKGDAQDNAGIQYKPTVAITVSDAPPGPPTAQFAGSPTTGTVSFAVSFTDQSTGTPTSWSWDFGDGGTSTAQSPSHTYTVAGTYTVSMTATNAGGSDINTKANYITANPCVSPTAGFAGAPTTGDAPLAVSFTDQTTNTPTSWSWDFGDGGTSNAQNPSYAFASEGSYTVTLSTTNACGSDQLVQTNYVTVTAGGPVTGEGFIISRNSDFSTDDRVFDRNETMYMKLWTDQVDFTDLSRTRWEMKDANGDRIRQPMTNNMDNTYTASFALVDLPTAVTDWTWKGEAKDNAGIRYKPSVSVTITNTTGLSTGYGELLSVKPDQFYVLPNYPNPFNPSTKISVNAPSAGHVSVMIYNLMGQKVTTLLDATVSSGLHTVEWDATNNASGMYMYVVKFGDDIIKRKMTLLK